jgi:hypothetical protein
MGRYIEAIEVMELPNLPPNVGRSPSGNSGHYCSALSKPKERISPLCL